MGGSIGRMTTPGTNPAEEISLIHDLVIDLDINGPGYQRAALMTLARDIEEAARKLGNHFEAGGAW
jgi:hypothetical protein